MKIFKFMAVALVAMLGLTACEKECDHDFIAGDYSKTILGTWSFDSETFDEDIVFYADGKFSALNYIDNETAIVDGTWTLNRNRLVLTTSEGATHFSGTISVYAGEVMLMTCEGSKDTRVYYYYVAQPLPKALVGTWTCLEGGFAEALTIHEDGSLVSTRLEGGRYWEDMEGEFMTEVDNSYGISLNDDYVFGKFEVVSGEILALIDPVTNTRRTYRYCKEDLSDEVVGMWVCTQTDLPETNMTIQTYQEDGKSIFTGFSPNSDSFMTNMESTYDVVGDLMFQKTGDMYFVTRLTYVADGTSMGDILNTTATILVNDAYVTSSYSFLRIRQDLSLADKAYDYSATYITNAKGRDKDITFLDTKFNFAKMDGSIIDKFLKSVLYNVHFSDENTLVYNCLLEGRNVSLPLPVEVDGNKVTIKVSSRNAAYRDVVVYAFQDADCSQFHMYMPTSSFENFFSNMSLSILSASGQVDIDNQVHVDAVYQEVADAIESINVSIVMKAAK